MYLSSLLIDVGDNPDRPRPGRRWLQNIYHVHQRLSMAFPSADQKAGDPEFLKPYDPGQFQPGRLLFRIDHRVRDNEARAAIIVQSVQRPDWDYAFQNARMFLAAPPQVRPHEPAVASGEAYRFRIRVNLSKKSQRSRSGVDLTTPRPGIDAKGRPKSQSKRVSLSWEPKENPEDVIREWFGKKAAAHGFSLRQCTLVHMGRITGSKPIQGASHTERPTRRLTFQSALLEGILNVEDEARFRQALHAGIGPAKAFGFGLLTISSP